MQKINCMDLHDSSEFSWVILSSGDKVMYPKYSKQWLSTMAHTIDCVWSRILNHGWNHGLLFSLFNFFGSKIFLN